MEYTLLWAALTAMALGWVGLRLWDDRVPDHALDQVLLASLVGVGAGRLTAMIAQGVSPLTSPGEIILVRGGVSTGAASLSFLATLVWSNRSSPRGLDALAPAVLLALAGWHTGCVWRGACLGTSSALPWAWALDGSAITRHPVELYAAAGLGLGAVVVSRLGWRPLLRSGSALALAGVIRLVTEPMRPSLGGGPVGWYYAAIAVGLIAVALGPRLQQPAHPPT